jgi:hypothetical protein
MKLKLKEFFNIDSESTLSPVLENDNTDLTMPIGDDEEMLGDDGEEEEDQDDWSTASTDDGDFDVEPTVKDVNQNATTLTGIHKKQAQLQDLEAQKDKLLMQLKGDVISLDQYKQAIGNIPMQIKKLRADLDKAMNVTVDDSSEEEAI